jgi:ribose-phosphate pyrophosphokinase
MLLCSHLISLAAGYVSVTAIADKLGVEFALIHRKRDGKSASAPEKMDLLVGDVKDKAEPYVSLNFDDSNIPS